MIGGELFYSPNYKTTQNYAVWQLRTFSPESDNLGPLSSNATGNLTSRSLAANPTAKAATDQESEQAVLIANQSRAGQ